MRTTDARVGSAVAATAFAAAFAIAGFLALGTAAGQALDAGSFAAFAPLHTAVAGLRPGGSAWDPIRHGGLILLCAGALALAVRAALGGRVVDAARAMVAVAVTGIVGSLLKDVLERPYLGDHGYLANTFPSGHAAGAAAALAAIAALQPREPWRRPVLVAAWLVAFAVGVASVAGYAHRPSDAIGGVCFAGALAALTWWGRPAPLTTDFRVGIAAIAAAALALGLVLAGAPWDGAIGRASELLGWVGLVGIALFAVLRVAPAPVGSAVARDPARV